MLKKLKYGQVNWMSLKYFIKRKKKVFNDCFYLTYTRNALKAIFQN